MTIGWIGPTHGVEAPNKTSEMLRGASGRPVDRPPRGRSSGAAEARILPGDPQFAPLARDVRIAAQAVVALAEGEEAAMVTVETGVGVRLPTINETPASPSLAALLNRWRAIERMLDTVQPASPEVHALMAEFERIRNKYSRALRTQRESG